MLLAACHLLGAGAGRTAIDPGCGGDPDAQALLEHGWSVLAIDTEQAGLAWLRADPGRLRRADPPGVGLLRRCRPAARAPGPCRVQPAVLPSASVPGRVGADTPALAPDGIFAGQLSGTRDSWAADPGMTFQDRCGVTRLLDGLEIIKLHKTERDGEAYSGPKHWHTYDILAREPAGHAPPAG
jgi:hypothetical protein